MAQLTIDEQIALRKISFDDIERATGRSDWHTWGSDASRKKRASIVNDFKKMVAADPTILENYELKEIK